LLTGPRPTYIVVNPQQAASTLPPEEIHVAAARGVQLTPEPVMEISRYEQASNPESRPVYVGTSSTAQSILSKQQLDSEFDELNEKFWMG
jgi:hypothetical protein